MDALLALVFAQAVAGASPAGRPAECAGVEARASNVWERAKAPALRRYCDLLASGAAKLAAGGGVDEDVLRLADEAERTVPGRAAPAVLRGRALARLRRYPEAYAALREARARDDRALDDPLSLLTFARAALRTGHVDEARAAYRALLPRASSLGITDRGPAYLEAGLVLLRLGPSGVDEAVAVLRQARREALEAPRTAAVLVLALALDRAGARDEAEATLDEGAPGDPRAAVADVRTRYFADDPLDAAELDAALAEALARRDPQAARAAWEAYLAHASGGPWAEHARQAEARLRGHAARGR